MANVTLAGNNLFFWKNFTALSKRVKNVKKHPREEEVPLPFVFVQSEFAYKNIKRKKQKKTEDKQKNHGILIVVEGGQVQVLVRQVHITEMPA